MKRQAYTMIAMIVLVGSMAVAAQAQTSGRTQLIANIPFEFNVGSKTLPAGEYLVLSTSAETSNVVLKIQSQDGKASAMLQTGTVEGKQRHGAQLLFNRYGDRYFFAQAWTGVDRTRLEASKSSGERRVEREFAAIKKASESVAVTARR